MKIFLISCLSVLGTMSATAQRARVGVVAGLNLNAPEMTYQKRLGGHIGVKGEMFFTQKKKWYMDASALLSLQNWNWGPCTYANGNTYRVSGTPYYLKVPVHIGRKWTVGKEMAIFVSGGAFASFGLFGNYRDEAMPAGGTEADRRVTKTKIFTKDAKFGWNLQERLDYGVGIRAGMDINRHIQVSVSYDHGLRNLYGGFSSPKQNMYTLTAGYMF